MDIEGIIGIVAGAVGFATALVKYLGERRHKRENVKLKAENEELSNPILISLEAMTELQSIVQSMYEQSCADRFLMFVARNGKTELKRTTAIYEQHRSSASATLSLGATKKYIGFVFDAEYLSMLKRVESTGFELVTTETMVDSDLKRIYQYESVTASKVFFIMRTALDEENDLLWYASIATHANDGYTDRDKTVIKSYYGQIKAIMQRMNVTLSSYT